MHAYQLIHMLETYVSYAGLFILPQKNHRIKLANTERLMQINIIYHSGICDFLGLFAFVVILFVLIFICRYLTL